MIHRCNSCGVRTVVQPGQTVRHHCDHQPPPRGIGDVIERTIKWATRGRIKPCGGCRRRRDRLNRLWPFSDG